LCSAPQKSPHGPPPPPPGRGGGGGGCNFGSPPPPPPHQLGVRRPGPGNDVAWRKGTWRAGPKDRSSYWLCVGGETDRSRECCRLAQRDMAGWVGRHLAILSRDLKITKKRRKSAITIFSRLMSPPISPVRTICSSAWSNLRQIKAVCGLISRPMHNFLLFFYFIVTIRYKKEVVQKFRYS
jgi:hypothetical protein